MVKGTHTIEQAQQNEKWKQIYEKKKKLEFYMLTESLNSTLNFEIRNFRQIVGICLDFCISI